VGRIVVDRDPHRWARLQRALETADGGPLAVALMNESAPGHRGAVGGFPEQWAGQHGTESSTIGHPSGRRPPEAVFEGNVMSHAEACC